MFLPVKLILFIELTAFWFFVCRTCCILIFVRKTCCMFICLFAKLVPWFLSPLNRSYSWNLLLPDFCSWSFLLYDFCSWNMLHVDVSLCESYWLFFSPRETDFAHGTCWSLIFVRRTCCMLTFFKLGLCWFFSSLYLCMDFSHRETNCVNWFFFSWNFFSQNLLHVDFSSSLNLYADFFRV